jgi:hypothetical protein
MSVLKKWLPVLVVILAIVSMVFGTGCEGGSNNAEAPNVVDWVKETDPKLQGQTKIEVKTVEATTAAKETEAEAQETAAKSNIKGVMYETEKFSILVPDGWEAKDVSNAGGGAEVVITKDNDAMQLSVIGEPEEYTEDIPDAATFCKKQIEHMAKGLNGTAPEEITMFGIKFFKTTYTLNGSDQTIFYGDINGGDIVKMLMAGKDHQNNVEIKAIMESIKFK